MGAGGLRGASSHSRSGGVAVTKYLSSKVRRRGCALLEANTNFSLAGLKTILDYYKWYLSVSLQGTASGSFELTEGKVSLRSNCVTKAQAFSNSSRSHCAWERMELCFSGVY